MELLGKIAIFITIAGGLALLYKIIKWFLRRPYKKYYDIIWKRSSALKPGDIMGLRGGVEYGYNEYYKHREIDTAIRSKIANAQNVLVIGNPLAGKTRAVLKAVSSLKKNVDVLVPQPVDFKPDDFNIPLQFPPRRQRLVIFNDIDKFAARQNFEFVLGQFEKAGITVVATCRSGPEYKMMCDRLEREQAIFGNPIEIATIGRDEAESIAEKAGKTGEIKEFDGNIGSIFLPLDTMRSRYQENCGNEETGILISINRLYNAGIYEGNEVFDEARIKLVCLRLEGINKKANEWRGLIKHLSDLNFIARTNKGFKVEETYLQKIIEADFDPLENLKELLKIFADDPDALFKLGNRACNMALYDIRKAALQKIALAAYSGALTYWTYESDKYNYAMTQHNLGAAYAKLAEAWDEHIAPYCRLAIEAYNEALKIRTLESYPMQYAMTLNNLGAAYNRLAEVAGEDRVANCRLAIKAYKEALKVRTLESLPIQYAKTQNNLGVAHRTLAEVEDSAVNCQLAIKAYNETLKVHTFESFPMYHAMTQNNLGVAFWRLAVVENKAANCQLAIKALKQALKVDTLESFPIDYAKAQYDLGNAYITLSEVEEKAANCKKAIKSFQEALKVRTSEKFPMDYAMTQNNLGIAYCTLSEVEEKAANCKKAIKCYEEALKVRTLEKFPMQYAATQYNLGLAYRTLAYEVDQEDNCRLAREALVNALGVYKKLKLAYYITVVENALDWLAGICGDSK